MQWSSQTFGDYTFTGKFLANRRGFVELWLVEWMVVQGTPSTPSSCLHPANALMLSVRFSLGELKYFLQYHDYNYFGGEFEGVK